MRFRAVWPCAHRLQLATVLVLQRRARSFLCRFLFVLCWLRMRCHSRCGCCTCSSRKRFDGCWRAGARVGACGVPSSFSVLHSL